MNVPAGRMKLVNLYFLSPTAGRYFILIKMTGVSLVEPIMNMNVLAGQMNVRNLEFMSPTQRNIIHCRMTGFTVTITMVVAAGPGIVVRTPSVAKHAAAGQMMHTVMLQAAAGQPMEIVPAHSVGVRMAAGQTRVKTDMLPPMGIDFHVFRGIW